MSDPSGCRARLAAVIAEMYGFDKYVPVGGGTVERWYQTLSVILASLPQEPEAQKPCLCCSQMQPCQDGCGCQRDAAEYEAAAEAAAALSTGRAPEPSAETIGRCPTCHGTNYDPDTLPTGPFTETAISAHTRVRRYEDGLILIAQWEEYVWLDAAMFKDINAALSSSVSALKPSIETNAPFWLLDKLRFALDEARRTISIDHPVRDHCEAAMLDIDFYKTMAAKADVEGSSSVSAAPEKEK